MRGDFLWRDLYVRGGVISIVPCTSSIAGVRRSELLSAVVFSRVADYRLAKHQETLAHFKVQSNYRTLT